MHAKICRPHRIFSKLRAGDLSTQPKHSRSTHGRLIHPTDTFEQIRDDTGAIRERTSSFASDTRAKFKVRIKARKLHPTLGSVLALRRDRLDLLNVNELEQPEQREACRYAKPRFVYSFVAKAKLLASFYKYCFLSFCQSGLAPRRWGGEA